MTEAFDFNILIYLKEPFFWLPTVFFVAYLIFTYSQNKFLKTLNSSRFIIIFALLLCYQAVILWDNYNDQEENLAQENKNVLLENGYNSQALLFQYGSFFPNSLEKCIESNKDYVLTDKALHIFSEDAEKHEVRTRTIYIFCQN